MLVAVCRIEGVWVSTHSFEAFPLRRQVGTGLPWYALHATSHTPVPNWLMGMESGVQAAEYTPSERACKHTVLIRGVLTPALQSFEDGITRRSAKLSQAAKPPLESRGALFECRAPTKH